jgi:Flp pilus assembly protein TadG
MTLSIEHRPQDQSAPALGTGANSRARSLLRNEDGGILIFGMIVLILMLVVGGIAVDLMRYEFQRSRLQSTVDRSILAAASLSQEGEAQAVVESYFEAADLRDQLRSVTIDQGLNFRTVSAQARTVMPTLFMRLVGIDSLTPVARGTAEERVSDVEISLVLDLSGSMNDFDRLPNLQAAARDFVDTVLGNQEGGLISVSMIPYTGQVNAGPDILRHYNVANAQPFSHCVLFSAGQYGTTALPTNQQLAGAGHGFPFEFTNYYSLNSPMFPGFYDCPVPPGNAGLEIVPLTNDADYLRNRIDAMQALGATSIDIGMRWGTALLDPSMQPVVSGLVTDGVVPATFDGRPFAFDRPDTMKVLVLMTDGENFPQRRFISSVRSGPSNVWMNDADPNSINTYSLFNPSTGQFWRRHDETWSAHPYGNDPVTTCQNVNVCTRFWSNGTCRTWETQQQCTTTNPNNARRLDWPELFHRATPYWVARNIIARAEGFTHANGATRARQITLGWQTEVAPATMDTRLLANCQAARNAGIIVFAVAFEAPDNGAEVLRQCASSPAHFFEVNGLDVRTAFRTIARQIMQLRLTQ